VDSSAKGKGLGGVILVGAILGVIFGIKGIVKEENAKNGSGSDSSSSSSRRGDDEDQASVNAQFRFNQAEMALSLKRFREGDSFDIRRYKNSREGTTFIITKPDGLRYTMTAIWEGDQIVRWERSRGSYSP